MGDGNVLMALSLPSPILKNITPSEEGLVSKTQQQEVLHTRPLEFQAEAGDAGSIDNDSGYDTSMMPSKADAIRLCVERLVRMTSERIPDSTEAHLSYTNKK